MNGKTFVSEQCVYSYREISVCCNLNDQTVYKFRWNKAYQSHLHETYTIAFVSMFCDFSIYFWCFRSTHSSFGPACRFIISWLRAHQFG